jgi:hypothetical protein
MPEASRVTTARILEITPYDGIRGFFESSVLRRNSNKKMRSLRIFKFHYTTRTLKRKQFNQCALVAPYPQHAVPQRVSLTLEAQHIEDKYSGLVL